MDAEASPTESPSSDAGNNSPASNSPTNGDHGLGPLLSAETMAARDRLPTKPDGVVLTGSRVMLRPATLDDVDELFAISNGTAVQRLGHAVDPYDPDELIWRYMPFGPFQSTDEFTSMLSPILQRPDWRTFVVADRHDGALVGSASLLANSPADLKVEIGALWYCPAVQALGVNLEACRLLIDYLLDLGYLRVEWKCHAANERSRAAATRLGFRFEGVQERHSIQKGRRRDTAWFRILRDEWVQADSTDATG